MVKGTIIVETTFKGCVIPQGEDVEILGAEFSNLYPIKEYTPVKYQDKKVYIPKNNLKIIKN